MELFILLIGLARFKETGIGYRQYGRGVLNHFYGAGSIFFGLFQEILSLINGVIMPASSRPAQRDLHCNWPALRRRLGRFR